MSTSTPLCPRRRGMGRVPTSVSYGHPLFGKSVPCSCLIQRQAALYRRQLRQEANLNTFRTPTFASFNGRVPGVQDALRISQRYTAHSHGWSLLVGSCGSGKTHLAAVIANSSLENGTTLYFTSVPDLLDALHSTFDMTRRDTHLGVRVLKGELLVLDNPGVHQSTAWSNEQLLRLFEYRRKLTVPTILTGALKDLLKLDERLRSLVFDERLITRGRQDTAQDYRLQRKPHVEKRAKPCTTL